ncbi:MAG: hypothetical protein IJT59_04555, partial [Desulfovibrionaceae bacterium]|nr:hypothetical protein [Desulfovibrionaceae bacterium]
MEYLCPICHGPLKRFPRKNKPEEYFWVCSQNCCYCDDLDGTPFLAQCVECKRVLSRRISPKTGQTYVACFNKEAHTSGQTIFYNQDGTPQTSLKA